MSVDQNPEPEHQSVEGYLTTKDPGPNRVDFRVAFPTAWNGRFLFEIQGGVGGTVPAPTPDRLREGYVVATTSRGTHPTGPDDLSTLGDAAQALDFGGRAVHVVSTMALNAVRAHYRIDSDRIFRYVIGCSTGANVARAIAETYPEDFDGVVAAAHVPTLKMWMYWGRLSQYLERHPDAWIPPAGLAELDRFITSRNSAAFETLSQDFSGVDPGLRSIDFLTSAQKGALRLLLDGWEALGGTSSSSYFDLPGYWPVGAVGWARPLFGVKPPTVRASAAVPATLSESSMTTPTRAFFGSRYDYLTEFDFESGEDVGRYQRNLADALPQFMFNPRKWTVFNELGGRMVWWVGTHDSISWAPATVASFGHAVEALGTDLVADVLRLYIAPGTAHCRDGTYGATYSGMNTEALNAVVDWVESDTAPGDLCVATTAGPRAPVVAFARHES